MRELATQPSDSNHYAERGAERRNPRRDRSARPAGNNARMDSNEPDTIVLGEKGALGPLRADFAAYTRSMNQLEVSRDLDQTGIATPLSRAFLYRAATHGRRSGRPVERETKLGCELILKRAEHGHGLAAVIAHDAQHQAPPRPDRELA